MMKISLVIGSRANWGRSRSFALAAAEDPNIDLDLILIGSAIEKEFGSTEQDVSRDGFHTYTSYSLLIVEDDLSDQALATADGIRLLTKHFLEKIPDYVVTIADRFETMSTGIAASYSNIPLVHIQGGEIIGNIDDKVRNAISMLADIHFPSSELAYERLVKIVKNPEHVYMYGCPAMDTLKDLNKEEAKSFVDTWFLKSQDLITISMHPDTKNIQESLMYFKMITNYIQKNPNRNYLILKPNIDAGNFSLRKVIDALPTLENVKIVNGLHPKDYARALITSKLLIGNSSSFIRESSTLGVQAIILGERQQGRDLNENIYSMPSGEKLHLVAKTYFGRRYKPNIAYGEGSAGESIMKKLNEIFKENVALVIL